VRHIYASAGHGPLLGEGSCQDLAHSDIDFSPSPRLEHYPEDNSKDASGLGFLTMLNNYGATLAWEFTDFGESGDGVTVTTMAQLTV
jgi:hypothetical protein